MTPDDIKSLFGYDHLPKHLQEASKPFHDMALGLVTSMPRSAEMTLGIRHLWDAKNLIVYSVVNKQKEGNQNHD